MLRKTASYLQRHSKNFCHYGGGGTSPRKDLLLFLITDGLKLINILLRSMIQPDSNTCICFLIIIDENTNKESYRSFLATEKYKIK